MEICLLHYNFRLREKENYRRGKCVMTETKTSEKTKKRKVVKRIPEKKPAGKKRPMMKKQPLYRVVLWNDDDHTVEYVVRMMAKIFHYDFRKSLEIASRVHRNGKVEVITERLELAELRRDQIRTFGPDFLVEWCYSSMYATIELAE